MVTDVIRELFSLWPVQGGPKGEKTHRKRGLRLHAVGFEELVGQFKELACSWSFFKLNGKSESVCLSVKRSHPRVPHQLGVYGVMVRMKGLLVTSPHLTR